MNKKDPNYIASVEKAIAERYGKDTVQDFRSTWDEFREKDYLEQVKDRLVRSGNKSAKKEEIVADDVRVSKRVSMTKDTRICPVCKTYSFSGADDLYMNRFQCCYRCYLDFVQRKEDEWRNGDRPGSDYIEKTIRGRK